MKTSLNIPGKEIDVFCEKWKIKQLWVFGSYLRKDFNSQSDIDFMVQFQPDVRMSLLTLIRAERELSEIVGRDVDLVLKEDIERSDNWIRKENILNTAREIYAA